MTWVDMVIIVILAATMIKGFVKGLVREVCELFGIVLAIFVAYTNYQHWGDELVFRFGLPEAVAYPVAFAVIALGISVAAGLLGMFLGKLLKFTPVGVVDHLAGIGVGFAKGFIFVCILTVLLTAVPLDTVSVAVSRSPLAQQVLGIVPRLYSELEEVFPPGFPRWHRPAPLLEPSTTSRPAGFVPEGRFSQER